MFKNFILIVSLLFITTTYANDSSPTKRLAEKFFSTTKDALDQEKNRLSKCPIITQDLLGMTLHTSNGLSSNFLMDKTLYSTLAEISHIPVILHNIASKHSWQFNDNLKTDLMDYTKLLKQLVNDFDQSNIDSALKNRTQNIIAFTTKFIDFEISNHEISKESYFKYVTELEPYIEKNFSEGVNSQIEQFNTQLKEWTREFPQEQWDCLNVAILGTHGPRTDYVMKQFFQWYLKEPNYENRVIYVEFPDVKDIINDKNKAVFLAKKALVNNNYQLELGTNYKADPSYMQRDVLGEAAKKYFKTHGD